MEVPHSILKCFYYITLYHTTSLGEPTALFLCLHTDNNVLVCVLKEPRSVSKISGTDCNTMTEFPISPQFSPKFLSPLLIRDSCRPRLQTFSDTVPAVISPSCSADHPGPCATPAVALSLAVFPCWHLHQVPGLPIANVPLAAN